MNSLYSQFGLPMPPGELMVLVALTLARTVPALFMNPFLGGQLVSTRIKMGLAMAFTIILLPMLLAIDRPVPQGIPFFFLMIKEVVIGVTIGFITTVVFLGFGAAGRLVDTQRGANMAESMVYQLKERASVFGNFYVQVAIVVFLILDGHHLFISAFIRSFEILPVWEFPNFTGPGEPIVTDLARLTADLFTIAIQLGAPAVITLFVTDVSFGIVNRASPQVNVFNLSQPVKMFLGIVMIVIVLRILIDQMQVWMGTMLAFLGKAIGYLGQ